MALTKADLKAIKDEVSSGIQAGIKAVEAKGTEVVVGEDTRPVEEVSDDRQDALDETEAALIKQLKNPRIVIYKGRRGNYKVNETQEQLNALLDYRKERKAFRTGSKI